MTTADRTSVEALRDAFIRRLKVRKEDAAAAAIAEELLEEVKITSPHNNKLGASAYLMVDAAAWAMELLPEVPQDGSFPKTRNVLWTALIEGWLQESPDALTPEGEEKLARAIGQTKLDKDKNSDRMLARLREGLDSAHCDIALAKIVGFLKGMDRDRDDDRVIKTIGRMLGRYVYLDDLPLLAHVIGAIRSRWERTLSGRELAIPHIVKYVSTTLKLASTIDSLFEVEQLPQGVVEVEFLNEIHVRFSWRIPIAGADAISATFPVVAQGLVGRAREAAMSWRRSNPLRKKLHLTFVAKYGEQVCTSEIIPD